MAKVSLAEHLKERASDSTRKPVTAGPFLTLSRQYGCWGFSLGLMVREILNEGAPPEKTWAIYNKEILSRLATETNMAEEMLDRERRSKPGLLVDFLRGLTGEHVPPGFAIRHRIAIVIRGLAIAGRAIIVGQGGAAATRDLPNGLSIRLQAPEDWCVRQIASREGIGLQQARLRLKEVEAEREYARRVYQKESPRPPFDIMYDCSAFTMTQLARQIACAMKLKGMI